MKIPFFNVALCRDIKFMCIDTDQIDSSERCDSFVRDECHLMNSISGFNAMQRIQWDDDEETWTKIAKRPEESGKNVNNAIWTVWRNYRYTSLVACPWNSIWCGERPSMDGQWQYLTCFLIFLFSFLAGHVIGMFSTNRDDHAFNFIGSQQQQQQRGSSCKNMTKIIHRWRQPVRFNAISIENRSSNNLNHSFDVQTQKERERVSAKMRWKRKTNKKRQMTDRNA